MALVPLGKVVGKDGLTTSVTVNSTQHTQVDGDIDLPNYPTALSEMTNDTGFITMMVNNLLNYYLKSETYSALEIDSLISSVTSIRSYLVVDEQPTDPLTTIFYLIPNGEGSYNQYIYSETKGWVLLNDTSIDLSGYALKSEIPVSISELTNDLGYVTKAVTDLTNYYTKTQADNLLQAKVDESVYSAKVSEIETEIADVSSSIPTKLPNPNALTFTGAVTGSYDGSSALSVNIPSSSTGGTTVTVSGNPVEIFNADTKQNSLSAEQISNISEIPSIKETAENAMTEVAADEKYEPKRATNGTAYNKNFGETSSDVARGDAVANHNSNADAHTNLARKTELPTKLPNPQVLTFTGAVTDTYDGSVAKTINIPEGGGSSEIQLMTSTKLGGATAESVTDGDGYTQEVKVNPITRRLMTKEGGGSSFPEGGTKGQALTVLEDTPERELGWVTPGALSEPAIGDVLWTPRPSVQNNDRYAICNGTTIDVGDKELFIEALNLSPVMEWVVQSGVKTSGNISFGELPDGTILGINADYVKHKWSSSDGSTFTDLGLTEGDVEARNSASFSDGMHVLVGGSIGWAYRIYTSVNEYTDTIIENPGGYIYKTACFDGEAMYLFTDSPGRLLKITPSSQETLVSFGVTHAWLSCDIDLVNRTIAFSSTSGIYEASLDDFAFTKVGTIAGPIRYASNGDLIAVASSGAYYYRKEDRVERQSNITQNIGAPAYLNGLAFCFASNNMYYSSDNGQTYQIQKDTSIGGIIYPSNGIHSKNKYTFASADFNSSVGSLRYMPDNPVQRADYTTPNLNSIAFIRLA